MGAVPAWSDASVTLTSTPADGGGIASVQYQYRVVPGGRVDERLHVGDHALLLLVQHDGADHRHRLRLPRDRHRQRGAHRHLHHTVTGRIDHVSPTVTMTAPAANLAGSVTLASTAADANSGVASVLYEYKLSSGSTWTTACTGATTPFTCAFNTASVADGLYDFRATATDNAGRTTTSAAVTSRRIDNTNPVTSTLAAVGTNLAGNVNFTGTAADNAGGSGVAQLEGPDLAHGRQHLDRPVHRHDDPVRRVHRQRRRPRRRHLRLPRGRHRPRRQHAGLDGPDQQRVDTDGPVTSVATPVNNARVSGNVTMTANATDPAGVTTVDFQVLLGGDWFTFCTDNTAAATPARATRPRSRTAPTRPAWSRPTPSGTRPSRRRSR